jgi:hypothetical protein
VVHFVFEFYGFATYSVLIKPNDLVARLVLNTVIETGDYFFFALNLDHGTAAFRWDIVPNNLIRPLRSLNCLPQARAGSAGNPWAVRSERGPDAGNGDIDDGIAHHSHEDPGEHRAEADPVAVSGGSYPSDGQPGQDIGAHGLVGPRACNLGDLDLIPEAEPSADVL